MQGTVKQESRSLKLENEERELVRMTESHLKELRKDTHTLQASPEVQERRAKIAELDAAIRWAATEAQLFAKTTQAQELCKRVKTELLRLHEDWRH